MASGGYPNFHSSANDHRGGGRGSHRGRPNEQSTESVTSLHDPTVVSGISSHRGRGGHLRARGRGSRRPHDTRHGNDEANSKYIHWAK